MDTYSSIEVFVMDAFLPADVNPTGITTFDHRGLAGLPEYWLAARALHDLRRRMVDDGRELPWEEWLAAVHAMLAAPFFADVCPRCLNARVLPCAAVVRGDRLEGVYRCVKCAHPWRCGWATWEPAAPRVEPYGGVLPFDVPADVDVPRGDAA